MTKIDIKKHLTKKMKKVLEKEEELSKNLPITTDIETIRLNYQNQRKFWNSDTSNLKIKKIKSKYKNISFNIYYPSNKKNLACTLFIHGGGFIVGSPQTHERIIKYFCKYSNNIVVAIDYKLSPEYKFPFAIKECATLIKYLYKNSKTFKINKNQISLMGDSAGANLALGTTLYLRDKEKNNQYIKGLLLFYGLYGLKNSPSRKILGGPWDGLTKKDIKYYEQCYFKNAKKEKKNIYYNCLKADFSYGIPPIFLAVGDMDPLLDDNITLKEILEKNSIKCKLKIYKGILHAFLHYSKILPESKKALISASKFLKKIYN